MYVDSQLYDLNNCSTIIQINYYTYTNAYFTYSRRYLLGR